MNGYKPLGMTTEADNYISKREDLMKIYKEIFETCDKFLSLYEGFLKESERCRTMQLAWGVRSVERYKNNFLLHVLMNSYNVFDESHKRYPVLLGYVEANNPEWLEKVVKGHNEKLRKCKVSVYPLEEALTA